MVRCPGDGRHLPRHDRNPYDDEDLSIVTKIAELALSPKTLECVARGMPEPDLLANYVLPQLETERRKQSQAEYPARIGALVLGPRSRRGPFLLLPIRIRLAGPASL